jgi:hypothetical protein
MVLLIRTAYIAIAIAASAALSGSQVPSSTGPASGLSCEEMELFLKTAKIVSKKDLAVGVTGPRRATLSDGQLTHDAAIQIVEESKLVFRGARSTEFNFRDSWKFNVAGYELAKMLRLNMVPPYVERTVDRGPAAVSWWISDVMMERDRYKARIPPPDPLAWNREMYTIRVFHQLIYDSDPNLTNLLITKDWHIWMIDFTRAFRWAHQLQKPKELVGIDRSLLARLRELTADALQRQLGAWLGKLEIDALLARRDLLVQHFDSEIARRGEAAILYDIPRTSEPCGTGLK